MIALTMTLLSSTVGDAHSSSHPGQEEESSEAGTDTMGE